MIKLACPDFTWPLMPHTTALDLIRSLDFEAVVLGLFGNRSHIRPEVVREDVPKWAGILGERTGRAGLEVADLFVQAWTDVETMAVNNPDAKQRADGDAFFLDMLELARRLNSPGITTLPGVRFGDESWDASIRRSAEGLKWRVDQAAKHDILVSIEPHLGSNVDTPDKVAQLVELAPGLKLSLDYPQFTCAGFSDSEVEPLLVHNRQLHCRGGAVGMMQASFRDNTIDYRHIVERLKEMDFSGYVSIEYVWMDWLDCNRTDNISETIQFRDLVRAAIEGREYRPVALTA